MEGTGIPRKGLGFHGRELNSMEGTGILWKWHGFHGSDMDSMEGTWISWKGGGFHGRGMDFMEGTGIPWKGHGFPGREVDSMEGTWIPWKGGGFSCPSDGHRHCPLGRGDQRQPQLGRAGLALCALSVTPQPEETQVCLRLWFCIFSFLIYFNERQTELRTVQIIFLKWERKERMPN